MAARQLSDGRPDGQKFGQTTTDSIGFYGVTPAAQPSGATQAEVTLTATTVTDTVLITDVANVTALVHKLREDLVTLGLIAGA